MSTKPRYIGEKFAEGLKPIRSLFSKTSRNVDGVSTATPTLDLPTMAANVHGAVPLTGSGQDRGTRPGSYECTASFCTQRFSSLKAMQRHKRHAPDHFYCKKCDVDCADWEDLTEHKVAAMDYFHRNRDRLGPDGQQPRHITCEFCGEDFKTFGGRKMHREREHQAEQSITCPGCEALFTRASSAIAHLETGSCETFSEWDFKTAVLHKYIMQQIEKNFGEFSKRIAKTTPVMRGLLDDEDLTSQVGESVVSTVGDDDDGGVALLDLKHEEEGGYLPLELDRDLIDLDALLTRAMQETWLKLQQRVDSATASMMKLSTSDDASARRRGSVCSSVAAGSIRSGGTTRNEPFPVLPSRRSGITTLDKPVAPPAWSIVKTAKTLFAPNASIASKKPLSAILSTTCPLSDSDFDLPPIDSPMLLTRHFYDPSSPDYNPSLFHDPLTDRYICPFPDCEPRDCQYDSPMDLEGHFSWAHLRVVLTCPCCLKRFDSATAMVSHIEAAGGRCKVKGVDGFDKVSSFR